MSRATVGVVGPCAAGKSTLAAALSANGYRAKQIVQEHSYAPQMWRLIDKPDYLIYLDASFESCSRRKQLNWSRAEYAQQITRLADAREHCDLYLDTDQLGEPEVIAQALAALESHSRSSR